MAKKNVSEDIILEGLDNETVNEVVNEVADFTSLDYLKSHTPEFPKEVTSAKCKLEREPKVQAGLDKIADIAPELSKLFILMCNWWENKTARTTIKKAIDEEAASKGIDATLYMQETLRKEVEKFEGLQDAVDRMKYAITYFKPRTAKEVYKAFRINGKPYNVSLTVLAQLKEQYPNDMDKVREELIKVSTPLEVTDEL